MSAPQVFIPQPTSFSQVFMPQLLPTQAFPPQVMSAPQWFAGQPLSASQSASV
jgi:hypothetical protein